MSINFDRWTNITSDSTDQIGVAFSRTSLLFRADPFVRMLSKDVIDALLTAIFSPAGLAHDDKDTLRVNDPADVYALVHKVFAQSPLAIVNDEFKSHVANLVTRAIFPQTFATITRI